MNRFNFFKFAKIIGFILICLFASGFILLIVNVTVAASYNQLFNHGAKDPRYHPLTVAITTIDVSNCHLAGAGSVRASSLVRACDQTVHAVRTDGGNRQ